MSKPKLPSPNNAEIIGLGVPVRYEGSNAYVYRPDPRSEWAWLAVIGNPNSPFPVRWVEFWSSYHVSYRPGPEHAAALGIDSLENLPENPQEIRGLWCPFCSASYANRFETRPDIKGKCGVCQGSGDRALHAEAMVDHWLEEACANRDVNRLQALYDRLGSGHQQMEARRAIRAIQNGQVGQNGEAQQGE